MLCVVFFFQAEDGIRAGHVTGVQTCALPISRDQAHGPIIRSFAERAKANGFVGHGGAQDLSIATKQVSVQSLIAAYRSLGVRLATLDPLERSERKQLPELGPAFYRLTEADLDQLYSSTNTYFDDRDTMTLRDMLQALRATYCQTIGYEYMHISNPEAKRWIQERIEPVQGQFEFTNEEKRNILQQLKIGRAHV